MYDDRVVLDDTDKTLIGVLLYGYFYEIEQNGQLLQMLVILCKKYLRKYGFDVNNSQISEYVRNCILENQNVITFGLDKWLF